MKQLLLALYIFVLVNLCFSNEEVAKFENNKHKIIQENNLLLSSNNIFIGMYRLWGDRIISSNNIDSRNTILKVLSDSYVTNSIKADLVEGINSELSASLEKPWNKNDFPLLYNLLSKNEEQICTFLELFDKDAFFYYPNYYFNDNNFVITEIRLTEFKSLLELLVSRSFLLYRDVSELINSLDPIFNTVLALSDNNLDLDPMLYVIAMNIYLNSIESIISNNQITFNEKEKISIRLKKLEIDKISISVDKAITGSFVSQLYFSNHVLSDYFEESRLDVVKLSSLFIEEKKINLDEYIDKSEVKLLGYFDKIIEEDIPNNILSNLREKVSIKYRYEIAIMYFYRIYIAYYQRMYITYDSLNNKIYNIYRELE